MLTTLNDLGKWLFKAIKQSMQYWDQTVALIEKYLCCCLSPRLRKIFFRKRKQTRLLSMSSANAPPTAIKVEQPPAVAKTNTQDTLEVVVEGSEKSLSEKAPSEKPPSEKAPIEPTTPTESTAKEDHLLKPPPQPHEVARANTVSSDSEDDVVEIDDIVDREPPPRIPVPVALGTTVGWIFLCAGLFCIWEHDWTYVLLFLKDYWLTERISTARIVQVWRSVLLLLHQLVDDRPRRRHSQQERVSFVQFQFCIYHSFPRTKYSAIPV